MKQLSGLEASSLALESPPQTGHLASLAIFDTPDGAEDSIFPALCRALAPRIAALAKLEDRALELDYQRLCKRADTRTARVVH